MTKRLTVAERTAKRRATAAKAKASRDKGAAEEAKRPKANWLIIEAEHLDRYGRRQRTSWPSLVSGTSEVTMMNRLRKSEVPAWLYRKVGNDYVLFASSKKVVETAGQ